MRNRFMNLSVRKALDRLRRIKVSEMKISKKHIRLVMEVTAEQTEILKGWNITVLPAAFP